MTNENNRKRVISINKKQFLEISKDSDINYGFCIEDPFFIYKLSHGIIFLVQILIVRLPVSDSSSLLDLHCTSP